VPPDGIEALAAALAEAIAEDRPLAKRLKLDGFARRPLDDYASILQIERTPWSAVIPASREGGHGRLS